MQHPETIPQQKLEFEMPCGLKIKADAFGDADRPSVLLAHGGGQTRHSWGNTAKLIAAQGWYSIAYDHRGHGESDWAADANYDLQKFAEDQLHIAQSLPDKPVVVGASLGGLSAMLACGESKQMPYKAIILVDITPRMNQEGAKDIIGFMSERMDEGFESLDEAADIIANYTKRPRRKNTDGLRKNLRLGDDGRYRWHWDPNFTRQRMFDAKLGLPERMEKAAAQISEPILLVRGAKSNLVTEELAQEFLQAVPHAEFVDVENAHHMVAGDKNDIFSAAVIDFLKRL
ncbi:MAG: alpha/beta fold hydrolase [Pseudomonadales bacterium]